MNATRITLQDLQARLEAIRLDLIHVSVVEFCGRTDQEALEEFHQLNEALLGAIDETSRFVRSTRACTGKKLIDQAAVLRAV